MRIYSFTHIIIFISYLYLYLYIQNPIYVISYIIHKTINNNFINLASGVVCLQYLNTINQTLPVDNYIIYLLMIIMLYQSIVEIYINIFLSSINIIISFIKLISKKVIELSIFLNISTFEHLITILDGILNSIILIANRDERNNIYNRLRFVINKILHRIIQIELQNTLEDNQVNGEINDRVNGEINDRVNGEINDRVNGETNDYESFIEQLNEHFPLRCRGLENNDNQNVRIDSNICNICLEDLNYNQLYRTINCSHSFHPHCIDRWLFQSKFCPLCRTILNLNLGSTNNTN
jgi:hypothetical protein